MVLAGLIPVVLTFIFKLLETKTKCKNINKTTWQIIVGIFFGITACLATQYGVVQNGYVLNVRSASPLAAGLAFGGPAGIIAGVIGGLYRWLSIYWGMGTYTVIACSVATVLAGIFGSIGHRLFIAGKHNTWFYGVFIAIATEVFHMLLVFVTHMDDITKAFQVVSETAVTMIIANSISVFCTLLVRELFSLYKHRNDNKGDVDECASEETTNNKKFRFKKPQSSITQTFSIILLVLVIVLCFLTSSFTYSLQSNISEMEVEELLEMNTSDLKSDFQDSIDEELLTKVNNIKQEIITLYATTINYKMTRVGMYNKFTKYLATSPSWLSKYDVSEISIIDKDGIVFASSNTDNYDYDMAKGPQSKEFLCLLDGSTETYVQDFQPKDSDPTTSMKYAAAYLAPILSATGEYRWEGGFIQIGYDYNKYLDSAKTNLSDLANYRHIGQEGFMFIFSDIDGELISAPEGSISEELCVDFASNIYSYEDGIVYPYTNTDGQEYYFMRKNIECYSIIACIPVSEAEFSRNTAVYISAFMQVVVFFVLFILVFVLLKKIIVDNVHRINGSLSEITAGNLDAKIEVKGNNEEFISLSKDINHTVDRLKEYISEAEKRIDMELQFAKTIQYSVLPSVFPPYPNRKEFDIYASMDAAKEVGGDFYDFYLLDDNRLAFMIADVSGKGIPAAMFMMNVKSLIAGLMGSGLSVADVFTKANEMICGGNDAGMFVTAWMGILDLETGVVKFANAGHNPPIIKRKDGNYEYLKSRHGLVLAGMDGFIYKENEITLNPGDEFFLYTDGVTEATDANTKLFGEEKLIETLNNNKDKDATDLCKSVKDSINQFVGEAPQFDDITMLSLKYLKKANKNGGNQYMKELSLEATVEHIETVTEFVDAELEALDCSPKSMMQINVAIDELFGNIAHYAYQPGKGDAIVRVEVEKDPLSVIITFIDEGIPFDPLAKSDPDITSSAEDRAIGGLGIFMVKKTMDGIKYVYEDGKNITTIKKNL